MNRLFRLVHKVLGLLLSILFLMWFVSGIVMIYHSFPRVDTKLLQEKQEVLSTRTAAVDSLFRILPDSVRLTGLSVDMYLGRPLFHLKGKHMPEGIYADSLRVKGLPGFDAISRYAVAIYGTSPYSVDTLYELDQWIPFGYLKRELPIFKFSFDDPKQHQMYVSSKNGRILQMTDRTSRAWAWIGAIPHWVYFTALRQNQSLWTNFVVWTSGLGSIMCFTGLWVGVWAYYRNRKKGFRSPYKKCWYRWHHITGMIFGLFAMTFVFSGMMSMVDLPSWMQKGERTGYKMRFRGREGGMMSADSYLLDYRTITDSVRGVKSIEWASFAGYPYYTVMTAGGKYFIDALDTACISTFCITEGMVCSTVEKIHGPHAKYTVEWLDQFDDDYYSRRGMLTLPVYKVEVDDPLHTRHYFNPRTLYHRQIDDNSRLRGVLYNGLHSLNFKFLTDRPLLWNMVMYALLIGGTFLSLTGVMLTLGWIRKKLRQAVRLWNKK